MNTLQTLKFYLADPFKALRNTKNLAKCAMLLALSIASSYIMSFYPTNYIKISITFLFIAVIGMKYGPAVAGVASALSDIIGFISKPVGPYQPLLTLSALIAGIIYGLILYKDKTKLWRIILARAIVVVFISCLLDTYFISLLFGKAFVPLLVSRTIKNAIAFPIEIILLTAVIKLVKRMDN